MDDWASGIVGTDMDNKVGTVQCVMCSCPGLPSLHECVSLLLSCHCL